MKSDVVIEQDMLRGFLVRMRIYGQSLERFGPDTMQYAIAGDLKRIFAGDQVSHPEPAATAATSPAESAADEALRIVRGNREGVYGPPTKNFENIAALWTTYLAARPGGPASPILPIDVAYMMIAMKLARLANRPDHRDSLVDITGYADCADTILRSKSPCSP